MSVNNLVLRNFNQKGQWLVHDYKEKIVKKELQQQGNYANKRQDFLVG